MTYPTWRDDSAPKPTHQPCPACQDTWLITYGEDSVECPLHGAPLAKMPADIAARIKAGAERELGIAPLEDGVFAFADTLKWVAVMVGLALIVGAVVVVRAVVTR